MSETYEPGKEEEVNPAAEQWGGAEVSWGGLEAPRDPNSWKGTEGLPQVGSDWHGAEVTAVGGVEMNEGDAGEGGDPSDIDPAKKAAAEYEAGLPSRPEDRQ